MSGAVMAIATVGAVIVRPTSNAVAPKLRDHDARRRVEPQDTRLPRRDETVLKRHRHGSDGAVPAHRQAAGGFDEQDRDIAIGPCRRIENGARHDVVAARFEHQPGADPVEFGHEMRALFDHGGAVQLRAAAGHQPNRIAAGMAVDAEEAVPRHDGLRSERDGMELRHCERSEAIHLPT